MGQESSRQLLPDSTASATRTTMRALCLFVVFIISAALQAQLSLAQAPQGCKNLSTVFLSPQGSDSACCNTQATACASLKEALSRVSSGGSVLLLPGVHNISSYNPLTIPPFPLTIAGSAGGKQPTIDCQQGGCLETKCYDALCVESPLVIRGLTVRNGKTAFSGGCLNVANRTINIKDVNFWGCTAGLEGGALSLFASQASLSSAVISASSALGSTAGPGRGGGVAITAGSTATMNNLTINGCEAKDGVGGGIFVSLSSVTLSGASINKCKAFTSGGAVASDTSELNMDGVTLNGGKALGGGCLGDVSSFVTIRNSTFVSCVADLTISPSSYYTYGGAATFDKSTVDISASSFSSNTASANGGAIQFLSAPSASLSNVSFDGNSAGDHGGALSVEGAQTVSISNCNFYGNFLTSQMATGGAIYLLDAAGSSIVQSNFSFNFASLDPPNQGSSGGAIYISLYNAAAASTAIEGCYFYENQATSGGAIVTFGGVSSIIGCTFESNGRGQLAGAVLVQVQTTIEASSFRLNTAIASGGAIYVGGSSPVVLSNCRFESNSVVNNDGGALFVYSGPTNIAISNCSFASNAANSSRGGAIFSGGSFVSCDLCTIDSNYAYLKGGAISVEAIQNQGAVTFIKLTRCTLSKNYSPLGGGAVYLAINATASFSNCSLVDNNSTVGGAILVQDYAKLTMTKTDCSFNEASSSAGCLAVADFASASLLSCSAHANSAPNEGGAIRASGYADVSMTNCDISNNQGGWGGVIWAESFSSFLARGSVFTNNTAQFQGGAVYATHSSTTQVISSSFEGNKAPLGGAVAVDSNSKFSCSSSSSFSSNSAAAIVASGDANLNLNVCLFSSNFATNRDGGAITITDSVALNFSGCNFTSNAGKRGGALFADKMTKVAGGYTVFQSNAAKVGAAVALAGAVEVEMLSSSFSKNSASEAGGGVALLEQSRGKLLKSSFDGNMAAAGGAGVFINRAEAEVVDFREISASQSSMGSAKVEANLDASNSTSASATNLTLECRQLTFNGNWALFKHAAGFFEASYQPSIRVKCEECYALTSSDTIGTNPANVLLAWPGVNNGSLSSSNSSSPFVVKAAVGSPLANMTIAIIDSYGTIIDEDNSSVAIITPDPRISGILRATAVNGIATMPAVNVFVSAEEAVSFDLPLVVTAPSRNFADIIVPFVMSFCPGGSYFNQENYACETCFVGSWCAPGQSMLPCSDGSFSFYPGSANETEDCKPCDDDNLDCTGGKLQVAYQAWLDPDSRNSTPTTYSCIITNGCNGYEYESPTTNQCLEGYQETAPMCSLCSNDYFNFMGFCEKCTKTFTDVFPLLLILVILLWIGMFLLCERLSTIDVFLNEVQYLTIIASFNLNAPTKWVTKLIQIYNLTIFDPDIIGPNCNVTYEFQQQFVVTLLILLSGIIVHSLRYVFYILRKAIIEKRRGNAELHLNSFQTLLEDREHREFQNNVIQGICIWLDVCYMGVLVRVLSVFKPETVGDTTVLAFAPQIEWWSSTHIALFIPSVILTVFYLAAFPLGLAFVLFSAKRKKTILTEEFTDKFGNWTESYHPKYFWWHLVNMSFRVIFVCLLIFEIESADIQITATLIIQSVRIALEYKCNPFQTSTMHFQQAVLNLGEFFFTIGLVTFNYMNLKTGSIIFFVISTFLMLLPSAICVFYEIINHHVRSANSRIVDKVWEETWEEKKAELQGIDSYDIIEPSKICDWFRPHVISSFLLDPAKLHLVLQVRDRYQACLLDPRGLGSGDWVAQLRKPQLYAGLKQIFLGNRKGHITVARIPKTGVFCERHNTWHRSGRCLGRGSDSGKGSIGTGGGVKGVSQRKSWPPKLYKAASVVRTTSSRMDDSGAQQAQESSRDSGRGDLSQRTASSTSFRYAGAGNVAFVNGNGHSSQRDDSFLQANLDMAELTFTFQQNLARLVRAEKKRKKSWSSLRYVVSSNAIPMMLSWLCSASSTVDDQRLLAELIEGVREAALEDAGGLGWWQGIRAFYARLFRLRRKKAKESGDAKETQGMNGSHEKDGRKDDGKDEESNGKI